MEIDESSGFRRRDRSWATDPRYAQAAASPHHATTLVHVHQPPAARRLLGRGLVGLGWLLAAILVVTALLRGLEVLDTSYEVAIVGVSPWVLLLSFPLTVAAVVGRRWLLSGVAVLCVTAWSVWSGPQLWPVAQHVAAGPPVIRLFDANVSQSNRNLTEIAGEITRDRPTVVSLEELTPMALQSLRTTGVLAAYHWQLIEPQQGPGGMGLWSSLPLSNITTWTVDLPRGSFPGRYGGPSGFQSARPGFGGFGQIEIDALVHPPGALPIHLSVVHVNAPAFGFNQPAFWKAQMSAVATHLARLPRPLLVAGDFNATVDMKPLQRILDQGLTDAAESQGDGWVMTWPRNQAWVLPYLRIDHVLYSAALAATSYQVGDGKGSDHRPMMVTIAYRRR